MSVLNFGKSPMEKRAWRANCLRFTSNSKKPLFSRHLQDEAGFNAELNYSPQPIFHSINPTGSKQKFSSQQKAQQKQQLQQQYITPEHCEMIKYVQQSWRGVERDYKKSVNNYINNIDLKGTPANSSSSEKTSSGSTPLLLTGAAYHHTSLKKDTNGSVQDPFQPFDLETFWGNRILKRLTEEI